MKRPGELTLPLVERFVDAIEVVTDDEIAEAMVLLLERTKLVVEGAGAVGVAAVLSGKVPAPGATARTAVVLSGGNVDATVVAAVVRHHETLVGRSLVLVGRVADRPGELARLLTALAEFGVNVVDVSHVREGVDAGRARVRRADRHRDPRPGRLGPPRTVGGRARLRGVGRRSRPLVRRDPSEQA